MDPRGQFTKSLASDSQDVLGFVLERKTILATILFLNPVIIYNDHRLLRLSNHRLCLVYIHNEFGVNSIVHTENSDTATVLYLSTMKFLAFETKSLALALVLAVVALTTTLTRLGKIIYYIADGCVSGGDKGSTRL